MFSRVEKHYIDVKEVVGPSNFIAKIGKCKNLNPLLNLQL